MLKYIFTLLFVFTLSGCNFEVPEVDATFGKQNFVSAISLIELHKVRNGQYPQSLDDLEFLGDWDMIYLSSVKYKKTENGYDLDIVRGWVGKPSLEFPIKFKRGLGIEKTNVKWIQQ